jgi:hypothetical protein
MRTRPVNILAATAAAILLTSCSTFSSGIGYVTGSTQQKKQEEKIARIQAEVMAFADDYVGEVLDATSRIPSSTQETQVRVLGFEVRQATAAYEIASGASPVSDLLDMVVLVTATRTVVDAPWGQEAFGANGKMLSRVLAALEEKAWIIAGQVVDAEQERKLRQFIEGWLARNPEVHEVSGIRLADLSAMPGSTSAGLGTPTDVLRSIGLDPFGGIDPAVQEVQRSRLLAERAFYFAKRWPRIIELQTRLLTLQLAAQPAPAQLLADVSRASLAVESAARTAEGLPALVDREREAAIRQFLDALSVQETRARALLAEMRRTLDAGTGAANAVHGALGSLDSILAATSKPAPPGTPPSRPFDVTEYTRALEQLGRSATDLETLLRAVNQDAPRLAALIGDAGREASDRGRALVDHAFARLLTLVLVLVLSTLAAALLYRWASHRISRS